MPWRSASYTSPVTQSPRSNTANLRATPAACAALCPRIAPVPRAIQLICSGLSADPCSHQATRSCWIDPAIHSANRKLPLQIRGKPLLLRRTIQFGLKTSRRRRTSGARSFAGTGYYGTVTKLVEGETLGRFEQLLTTSSLFTTNGCKIA